MWLGGTGSLAEYNLVGNAQYGILITGRQNTVRFNTVQDNQPKGIFVVGQLNVVKGNLIERNGTGLHVYGMVPIDRPNRALFALEVPASSNRIIENTLRSNHLDLWDSKLDCTAPVEERLNTWTSNSATTRKPACL